MVTLGISLTASDGFQIHAECVTKSWRSLDSPMLRISSSGTPSIQALEELKTLVDDYSFQSMTQSNSLSLVKASSVLLNLFERQWKRRSP